MTGFVAIASRDLTVWLSPHGAALARVWLRGYRSSLVLGLPKAGDYADAPHAIGVIVGPLAGRISGAAVALHGKRYAMEPNAAPHCLHSGSAGLQHRLWEIEARSDAAVTFRCDLLDGACGLPGNRTVRARYAVEGTEMTLRIEATSDADTYFNPANHAYWTLDGSGDLTGHVLQVGARDRIETGRDLIPTGRLAPVADSPRDFRTPRCPVSGPPLDATFVLTDSPALRLYSARAKLGLTVTTNQPGLVLYTGAGLPERTAPENTPPIKPFSALAIEAQGWPDAPNKPQFPAVLLRAGQLSAQTVSFLLDPA